MSKQITQAELQALAAEFRLEARTARAVLQVESAGAGFSSDGRIKIQFEPHIFAAQLGKFGIDHTLSISNATLPDGKILKQYTVTAAGHTITNGVQGQVSEFAALEIAKQIHEEAALLSTSWGLGQIMGFNYKAAGFNSVRDMIDAFTMSEHQQFMGMLRFIKNSGLLDELQRKDWAGFAKGYNGSGYLMYKYDTRLAEAYDKL